MDDRGSRTPRREPVMKAHDVRRLKVCGVCGDLGTYHAPNGGHAIIKSPAGRLLHPRCMSRDLLLKCETAELVYISIALAWNSSRS